MKDTIKAVAFDIDGTMYANWRLYIQLGCYVARNLPFFIKYAKVRSILHRTAPLGDFYEYQARLLGIEMKIEPQKAKELIENNVYKGLTPYLKKVKPFPHLKECLEALKKAGLKIAILSAFKPIKCLLNFLTNLLCKILVKSSVTTGSKCRPPFSDTQCTTGYALPKFSCLLVLDG